MIPVSFFKWLWAEDVENLDEPEDLVMTDAELVALYGSELNIEQLLEVTK